MAKSLVSRHVLKDINVRYSLPRYSMPTHGDSAHPHFPMDSLSMTSGLNVGGECFVAPLALMTRTLDSLLVCTLNMSLSTRDTEESLTTNGSVQSWARDAPK